MKVSFIYSFADYEAIHQSRKRARRFARLRDFALLLLVLFNFGIGFWFIGLQLSYGEPLGWLSFANIAIGFTIILAIFVLGPVYRKWYLRQQMIEDLLCEFEFDNEGLTSSIRNNTTRTLWSGVIRADEDNTHYILWINKLQAYSIQKQAFKENEEPQFRELLIANVQNRTFNP